MKYRYFTLVLLFFIVSLSVSAQINEMNAVIETAGKDCIQWLSKIPAGQEHNYGFNDREEFKYAVAAKAYHIFILNNSFFNDTLSLENDYLQPTREWRVAVSVKDQNRIMLTVTVNDGTCKTVGVGAAGLAKELETYDPETDDAPGLILRVSDLDCEFLLVHDKDGKGSYKAMFLKSSSLVFNEPEGKLWTLEKALTSVKNIIGNK